MIYFVNLGDYFACFVTDRFQSILQFARHRGVVSAGGRCQQVSMVLINAACWPALMLQRLTGSDYRMPCLHSAICIIPLCIGIYSKQLNKTQEAQTQATKQLEYRMHW